MRPLSDDAPTERNATRSIEREVARTVRDLYSETGTGDTMYRAVQLAAEVVRGAEAAGITVRHRDGGIETPASTSECAVRVDALQQETGEGPCIEALADQDVVSVPNLEIETRWSAWTARAIAETEIRSMLCFRLFTNERVIGALNLYSTKPHAFTSEDVDRGLALSAMSAVAVARAARISDLESAIDARARVGIAVGMLVERFSIDPERAFGVLVRYSQTSNRKLRDIASELVDTGHLPIDVS